MLKSTIVLLSNKLAFMFMRHTLREHLILLKKILKFSFICSFFLSFSLATNLVTLDTKPWPVITWSIDQLMYFINIQKFIYIGITYMAALVVNFLAEEMVAFQTRRTLTTKEFLVDELRINTRAVIITMSNALSLIFKILAGISLVLAVLIYSVFWKIRGWEGIGIRSNGYIISRRNFHSI
ncbi:hypothetical protein [Terasakiella pusilla]|uniref:hypothetical protein n=1 Tax=Terasakiella pusilla TaxID=64973 RepID=UPI003AA99583